MYSALTYENGCQGQADACASDEHKLDMHELGEALPCHGAQVPTVEAPGICCNLEIECL